MKLIFLILLAFVSISFGKDSTSIKNEETIHRIFIQNKTGAKQKILVLLDSDTIYNDTIRVPILNPPVVAQIPIPYCITYDSIKVIWNGKKYTKNLFQNFKDILINFNNSKENDIIYVSDKKIRPR